jgi:transcriptional regulator with XRE-family HTH domain
MALSDRIKSLREAKGWTPNRLAKEATVPQPTIWRLEKGLVRNPKMEVLRKVANALGVTVDQLVGGTEQQLSLFERMFPSDPVGQAVFRGYEHLPPRRRQELLNFLKFIEQQEAAERDRERKEES